MFFDGVGNSSRNTKFLKNPNQNPNPNPFYRTAGYFFLGLVLSGAGIFVFTSAVGQNSFSTGLIALFLVGYGVFTLKNLISKKE
jgi:hypothetical protein